MSSHVSRIVLATLLASIAPVVSHAGYGSGKGGGGGGGGGGTEPARPVVPPVDHSASIQARKEVNAATVEVSRATADVAAVLGGLRRELEKTPAYQQLLAAQSAAAAQVEAARRPALAAVHGRADYVAAKAARDKAITDRDAMASDPTSTAQDRTKVALAVADGNLLVTKIENEGLAADPKFATAQATLLEIRGRITDAVRKFDESNVQNAEVLAANKVVEEKRAAVVEAQKRLAGAVATEAAAERERQKQMATAH